MNTPQIIACSFHLFTEIILPAFFICWLGFGKNTSKINFGLKLFSVWVYCLFIYNYSMWGFFPYYLRYLLIFALLWVTIKACRTYNYLPLHHSKSIGGWINFSLQLMAPLLFLWFIVLMQKGRFVEEKGIDIAFPLKEACIGHGGNSILINYHHADSTAQQYALDINKLNSWGMRADGLFPQALEKYAIYGDTVFSPCDGKIVKVKDGLNNFAPGQEDFTNLAGNNIILEYQGHLIVFAHLLKNSLLVATGDFVKKGQPIARVGNSGHTSEPHLHIHAVSGTDTTSILNGNGVPIYFNGVFAVRNDRIKTK